MMQGSAGMMGGLPPPTTISTLPSDQALAAPGTAVIYPPTPQWQLQRAAQAAQAVQQPTTPCMPPRAGLLGPVCMPPAGAAMPPLQLKVSSMTDELFDAVDSNRDGIISRNEFRGALKCGLIEGNTTAWR
mmetsp:Transcript_82590/g.256848  ORF Transcript_82590/g.256848 Transcript_82590/m.256848 type:complete len:130 (+) Transcript_82590:1-390(+)